MQLHCLHVLLTEGSTVTLLTCGTYWRYVQLHCWHVLLTKGTYCYTADMWYWLKVRTVTLLTCAADWQKYSYTADVCHWLYVIHKDSNKPQSVGSSLSTKTAINRSLCLLLSVSSHVLFHAVMILRTSLSSYPSFFLHRFTPQTVLLSVRTHSFLSDCSSNCTRKCVTAHHELTLWRRNFFLNFSTSCI